MRVIMLTGMLSMAAASAQAGSIDIVKANDVSRSIERVTCPTCRAVKTKKVETPVVELMPGTQKIEVRKVNGELKVFRTEAWLGGSPVTYVSKASSEQVSQQGAADVAADDQKGAPVLIDKDATTSAVTAGMGEPAKQVKTFNPQDFQLRVN